MFLDRVTADVIQALGNAYLIPDGDCLYIVSHDSDWLICVTAFTLAFPDELLFLIDNYTDENERKYLQWDLLCAEVYPDSRQYLPGKSKTVKTLAAERHPRGLNAAAVRAHISERGWALSDRGLDLVSLFNQGYARSIYPEAAKPGQFARDAKAQQYNFQYAGRVVAVDGAYFRAFYDMGFSVWAPTGRRAQVDKISHPVIAAAVEDGSCYVFGFMPPMERSGITTSPDGRRTYADASIVSWTTPEEATALIADDTAIYSPARHTYASLRLSPEERLDRIGDKPYYGDDVRRETLFAIGVLRWHGVDETSIMALLEAQRMPSYQEGYNEVMAAVDEALRTLSGNHAQWQRHNAEEVVKKARRALESLASLGVSAELGRLPELEALLRERVAV